MKWHNSRQVWTARADRELHNLRKKNHYWEDPEAARQRMRDWREKNPELQREIERRYEVDHARERKEQATGWRERNREHLRDRSKLFHYETRKNAPWKHLLRSRFRDAIKRGIPFELTPEWGEARWTGCCELTGIPFDLTRTYVGFYSPSIDRIVPELGYLLNNSRFLLMAVNGFKSSGTDADMLTVAKALILKLEPFSTS